MMYKVTYCEHHVETVYMVDAENSRDANKRVAEFMGLDVDERRVGGWLRSRNATMSAVPFSEPVKLYSYNTQTGEMS